MAQGVAIDRQRGMTMEKTQEHCETVLYTIKHGGNHAKTLRYNDRKTFTEAETGIHTSTDHYIQMNVYVWYLSWVIVHSYVLHMNVQ